jgi:hypothetical protein
MQLEVFMYTDTISIEEIYAIMEYLSQFEIELN